MDDSQINLFSNVFHSYIAFSKQQQNSPCCDLNNQCLNIQQIVTLPWPYTIKSDLESFWDCPAVQCHLPCMLMLQQVKLLPSDDIQLFLVLLLQTKAYHEDLILVCTMPFYCALEEQRSLRLDLNFIHINYMVLLQNLINVSGP